MDHIIINVDNEETVPTVDKKTAVIVIKDSENLEGFLYPDGAIRNSNGHYIVKPSYAAPTITTETSRDLLDARREKRERFREAQFLARLERAGGRAGIAGGVGNIIDAQIALATDTEKGSSSTKAAEFILQNAGLVSPRYNRPDQVTINADIKVLNQILPDIAQILSNNNDVIDAEFDDD